MAQIYFFCTLFFHVMITILRFIIPSLIIYIGRGVYCQKTSLFSKLENLFGYNLDAPRRIPPFPTPYTLVSNLATAQVCREFTDWLPTTKEWDRKLNPSRLTLCSKDHGGGGNCLYHTIAGILRENGYKIGMFDLQRPDISPGIRISIKAMGFKNDAYFEMKDIRKLAALAYVEIDPGNPDALPFFNVEKLKEKVKMTLYGLDEALDIKWNPADCLSRLELIPDQDINIAKHIYQSLVSTDPVKSWGSGDDIYALAQLLNIDVLLFHRDREIIQHIASPDHTPVCTILIYYYQMAHFQAAGIVTTSINSDRRRIFSLFRHFELEENLYTMLPKFQGKPSHQL